MKRSGAFAAALAGLTALEALSRISVPASVLFLSSGATRAAALTSALALAATVARGFASSFAIERSLRGTFTSVVNAALRLGLVDLRAERKIGLLADAAREAAVFEATVVPQVGAHAIAVVLTWGALVLVLGPLWALALVLVAAPLVAAVALAARRIRVQQQTAWNVFGDLAIELRVLVEACAELRAHDREPSFARDLVARAHTFARAERRANVWSATSASLASALVLVSATTPLGDHISALVAGSTGRRAAEIGILAGAALYFALGFGKLLEHRARFAPFRDTLTRFLAAPDARGPSTSPALTATPLAPPAPASTSLTSDTLASDTDEPLTPPLPSLVTSTIHFRALSCRHPGAARATPADVVYTWPPGRGLVLTGENGAGKSTLVLALLGLLAPSSGAIDIDGAPLSRALARALRRRTAYLAQSPFVEPGASVAWHLRLFARSSSLDATASAGAPPHAARAPISDETIDAALRRVGLFRILAEHASHAVPRDVLAGELSGGERQRMHLARILVHDADLVILDEPEAGLDREARQQMAHLFEDLARERRVLLIAHDPAIVPPSFDRLTIRGAPSSRAEHDRGSP